MFAILGGRDVVAVSEEWRAFRITGIAFGHLRTIPLPPYPKERGNAEPRPVSDTRRLGIPELIAQGASVRTRHEQ